ncbi:MAG TPA: hypothetical protein VLB69_10855, partial [Rudaea sp.]|nr:hypothetical protein [Rudaea sp.]
RRRVRQFIVVAATTRPFSRSRFRRLPLAVQRASRKRSSAPASSANKPMFAARTLVPALSQHGRGYKGAKSDMRFRAFDIPAAMSGRGFATDNLSA